MGFQGRPHTLGPAQAEVQLSRVPSFAGPEMLGFPHRCLGCPNPACTHVWLEPGKASRCLFACQGGGSTIVSEVKRVALAGRCALRQERSIVHVNNEDEGYYGGKPPHAPTPSTFWSVRGNSAEPQSGLAFSIPLRLGGPALCRAQPFPAPPRPSTDRGPASCKPPH